MDDELNTENAQLKEKLKQSNREIIDLRKQVIDLKSDKLDLLANVRKLCLQLEKKEVELDECIKSFQKKTNESSSYIKQVVTLAEELENANKRLAELELTVKPLRGGELPKFSSTPHVFLDINAQYSNPESPSKVTIRRNHSNKASVTLTERHSHIDSSATKDVFNSLPNQKRLSEIQVKQSVTKPTSELLSLESDGSSYSLSDIHESLSDEEQPKNNHFDKHPNPQTTKISPKQKESRRTDELDSKSNTWDELLRVPYTHWKSKHLLKWLTDFVGLPDGCVRRVAELQLTGEKIMKFTDKDVEKKIGINEILIRKKLLLALEDLRFHGPPGYLHANSTTAQMNTAWVTNYWLPEELGLPSKIVNGMRSQCVDMRVLLYMNTLDDKEIMKLINCKMTKYEIASIRTAVDLMKSLKYNLEALKQRRELAETRDIDPLVWTNQRLQRWFFTIKLDKYLSDFKTSGLHGALLVLHPFGSSAICKVLNIPADVAKGCQLKEKLHNLLNPNRSESSKPRINKSPSNRNPKSADTPITDDEPTPENTFNKNQSNFVRSYPFHNKSDGLEKQASSMSKIRRSFRNLSKRVSKKTNKNDKSSVNSGENVTPDLQVQGRSDNTQHHDQTDGDTHFHSRLSTNKLFISRNSSSRANKNNQPPFLNLASSAPNLSRHHKPQTSSQRGNELKPHPNRKKSLSASNSSMSSSSSSSSSSSDNESLLISTKTKPEEQPNHSSAKTVAHHKSIAQNSKSSDSPKLKVNTQSIKGPHSQHSLNEIAKPEKPIMHRDSRSNNEIPLARIKGNKKSPNHHSSQHPSTLI